jgi:hypothetical protein
MLQMAGTDRKVKFRERRSGKDRRIDRRRGLFLFFKGGMRVDIRRREDRNKIFWADRYSQTLFTSIVTILFLSVADALLTLFLTGHGATEINPVMAYYLNIGPYVFLCVKYLLTSLALVILLFCQNFFLETIKIQARSLFYVIMAAFAMVIAWEFFLVYRITS